MSVDTKTGASTEVSRATELPRSPIRWLRFDRFGALYAWALIIVLFGIITPSTFLTTTTLRIVAADEAVTAIIAVGVVIPFATGMFDLSVGFMAGLAWVVTAWLGVNTGLPATLIAVITVLFSAMLGFVNGFIVVKLRVASFIATLGMGSVMLGLSVLITDNAQIVGGISPGFQDFGLGSVLDIPAPFLYLLGIALVLWYVTEQTPIGRRFYATGGNEEAARLSGIKTRRYQWASLVVSATTAGFAGVVLAAKVGVTSITVGPSLLLPSFAAVLLGSTQVRPGRFNVVGALIGAYLLATGIKGLQLVEAGPWVGDVFNGAALVIAVAIAQRFRPAP